MTPFVPPDERVHGGEVVLVRVRHAGVVDDGNSLLAVLAGRLASFGDRLLPVTEYLKPSGSGRRSLRTCARTYMPVLSDVAYHRPAFGEALGLTWGGVDLAAGVVRLEPGVTKNREGGEFPIAALPPLADPETTAGAHRRCRAPRPAHRAVRVPPERQADSLLLWRMGRGMY